MLNRKKISCITARETDERTRAVSSADALSSVLSLSGADRFFSTLDAQAILLSVTVDYLRGTTGLFFDTPDAIGPKSIFIEDGHRAVPLPATPSKLELLGPGHVISWNEMKMNDAWMQRLCVHTIFHCVPCTPDTQIPDARFVTKIINKSTVRKNALYVRRAPSGNVFCSNAGLLFSDDLMGVQKIRYSSKYTHMLSAFDATIGEKTGVLIVWLERARG